MRLDMWRLLDVVTLPHGDAPVLYARSDAWLGRGESPSAIFHAHDSHLVCELDGARVEPTLVLGDQTVGPFPFLHAGNHSVHYMDL